jgi:GR25 family glycosyltransferase involved in LPS biosynthesis
MQDAWVAAQEHGPLIVLEDDAIVSERFDVIMENVWHDLPEDWDYFCLFVPDNQFEDYYRATAYDENGEPKLYTNPGEKWYSPSMGSAYVGRAYQGYSCVGIMYSQQGGKKLHELAQQYGMYTPVDCFIFQQTHTGRVNGYAHTPDCERPVTYDWHNSPTLVQDTERYS